MKGMGLQRSIMVALAIVLAAAGPARALSPEAARHLLARTGFGVATPAEVRAVLPLSREAAVDRLISRMGSSAASPPPAWVGNKPPLPKVRKGWTDPQRKAFQKKLREQGRELKQWWLGEMLATTSPLTERLVLFWHNHFVSSRKKVKWTPFMYEQNVLFRSRAAGNFAGLLRAVARDPAMILYLDNQTNRKGQPNENFAREVLELFTLGEGRGYGEGDIREAARAFTGWRVNRRAGRFEFNRKHHDDGVKTFLGHSGRFTGDDIIDIILEQPRVAEHITEKMWREFISQDPDPGEVMRLAELFRASGYNIKALLRGLLTSPHFWRPQNRGVLIKSPVDLLVGTFRLLELYPDDLKPVMWISRALGQDVMDPPNVKGWPGGADWITAATLPQRHQFLRRVSRGAEMASGGKIMQGQMKGGQMKPGQMKKSKGMRMSGGLKSDPITALGGGTVEGLAAALLPVTPGAALPPLKGNPYRVLRAILLDPAYQLK